MQITGIEQETVGALHAASAFGNNSNDNGINSKGAASCAPTDGMSDKPKF